MSNDAIENIAAQLESMARIEDAQFRIEQTLGGDAPLTTHLVANRTGFVRLAAWMLRGAIGEENVVSRQFLDFDNPNSEHFFDFLVRREQLNESPKDEVGRVATNFSLIFYLLIGAVIFLALVGGGVILQWILR